MLQRRRLTVVVPRDASLTTQRLAELVRAGLPEYRVSVRNERFLAPGVRRRIYLAGLSLIALGMLGMIVFGELFVLSLGGFLIGVILTAATEVLDEYLNTVKVRKPDRPLAERSPA